jgi:hypothetical protein
MFELIKIQPGCPYYGWAATIDLTCEEGLCSWLRQPSNTISSFIFFLVAFLILRSGQKSGRTSSIALGTVTALIGLASTMAHATHLKIFGFTDFTFQYLLIFVLMWFNFKRIRSEIPFSLYRFSGSAWAITAVVQWNYPETSILLYGVLFVILLATEWLAYKTTRKGSYQNYFICAGTLALGALAFFLDLTRLVCDPKNHIFQMHAVWHLLAALSLVFLDRHYRQFE